MKGECLNPDFDCPLKGKQRKSVGHHQYFPKREFVTPLERAFRNLSENILQRCQCEETEFHRNNSEGLPKPNLEEMILACTVQFEEIHYEEAA